MPSSLITFVSDISYYVWFMCNGRRTAPVGVQLPQSLAVKPSSVNDHAGKITGYIDERTDMFVADMEVKREDVVLLWPWWSA